MTEIVFDTLNVPNFFIVNQAVLSLYATGRTSGITVNCGSNQTFSVPIYEGYSLPHAVMNMDISGDHLSSYLKTMLRDLGVNLMKSDEANTVKHIKETLCYVSEDYALEE